MDKKQEVFKIDSDLMDLVRAYAKKDRRTIKATVDIILREKFTAKDVSEKK